MCVDKLPHIGMVNKQAWKISWRLKIIERVKEMGKSAPIKDESIRMKPNIFHMDREDFADQPTTYSPSNRDCRLVFLKHLSRPNYGMTMPHSI